MERRKRIAIDMDNVMADITSQLLSWYHRATGLLLSVDDMIGKDEIAVFPEPAISRQFLYEPGFFSEAPVMPDAQEVIAELNKVYEVFIVSAAMEFPNSLPEKYDWLARHFPFLGWQQFVFCGSKTVIKADYLIDDHLKNLDFFEGEALLFTAPHNQLINRHTRVNNWQEVANLLL
jgi:5'(3')-deoxyribonucleotidase